MPFRGCGGGFDYRDPDLWNRIATAAPDGIDIFFETSKRNAFERTLPLLAHGGRFVLITGIGSTVSLPLDSLYLRDASLRGFVISKAAVSDLAAASAVINDGISRGVPRVRIGTQLALEQSARAHQLIENGVRGRIVVLP